MNPNAVTRSPVESDAQHPDQTAQRRNVPKRRHGQNGHGNSDAASEGDPLLLIRFDSKVTHDAATEDGDGTHLLDYEAESAPTRHADTNVSTSGPHNYPPLGHESLVVVIRPKVGRATTYRPRATYFPPVAELEDDEQEARSRRSQEANDRRAARRAADFCIEHRCFAWVTLTFDDLHLNLDPVDECRHYLARVAELHRSDTGKYLEYRAVVANHDGRPHLHGLFSEDVDLETLRSEWGFGLIVGLEVVARGDVEGKVRYMMKNVANHRLTPHRFLSSKGGMEEPICIPTTGVYHARSIIADVVHPNPVHITSAQLFGGNPRITYRFEPLGGSDGIPPGPR
jgi:hypothetical protein